ncbi:DKNYY domain-containing protein [Paludisphaera rhizosphaerae]|uniref:DKNYY domain-containing protein n=1 Tax=Paludisphaera rhizosphaerae TaxID=2711216 RepID=UPI0013EBA2AF|nr:DKNYY domain-containing protein [Paludisphaera rhizosphaerae]
MTIRQFDARFGIPLRLILILACLVAAGCTTGYVKSGGEWTYVTINESIGREVRKVDADVATFRVLAAPGYACDKAHVYKAGVVLEGFDGATFEFLKGDRYARDKNHIYFDDSIVQDADRDTFQVLGRQYARDARNVYDGSLRMNVAHPDAFHVLDEGSVDERNGLSYFYSTDDLVNRLGSEFADHQVLYEAKGQDDRYRIVIPSAGTATDGEWLYEGPKRSRRVHDGGGRVGLQ